MQAGAQRAAALTTLIRHGLPAPGLASTNFSSHAMSRLLPLAGGPGLPQPPTIANTHHRSLHSSAGCPSDSSPPPPSANQPQLALRWHQPGQIIPEWRPIGSSRSPADVHASRGFATRSGASRRLSAARSRAQTPPPSQQPSSQPNTEQQTTQAPTESAGVPSAAAESTPVSTEPGTTEATAAEDVTHAVQPHAPDIYEIDDVVRRDALIITRNVEWGTVILGFEQANKYTVLDQDGNTVALMAEDEGSLGKGIGRQLLRTHRPFTATIFSPDGSRVLCKLRRPFRFINSTIVIEDGTGAVVGEVLQRWHLWKRNYDLYLGKRQFASIEGGLLAWEFVLRDAAGGVLALVDRNFQGFGKELFTDAGKYVVHFGEKPQQAAEHVANMIQAAHPDKPRPPVTPLARARNDIMVIPTVGGDQLDVIRSLGIDERTAVLAAAVSIDFDYFSQHSSSGGGMMPFFMPMPVPGYPAEAGAESADGGGDAGADGGGMDSAGAAGAGGDPYSSPGGDPYSSPGGESGAGGEAPFERDLGGDSFGNEGGEMGDDVGGDVGDGWAGGDDGGGSSIFSDLWDAVSDS